MAKRKKSKFTAATADKWDLYERSVQEPGADVALYLARHGVNVTVEQMHSNGLPVADVILNFARDNKINFIVIGAYSHSRSREIIFGGVTRSLLNKAEMPLLIAH